MIGLSNLKKVFLIKAMVAAVALFIPSQKSGAQPLNFVKQEGRNWILQNRFLIVHLLPASGSIDVELNDTKKIFRQEKGTEPFQNVKIFDGPQKGVEFQWSPQGKAELVFNVRMYLKDNGSDLFVECDMADRTAKIGEVEFLQPFVPQSDQEALIIDGRHLFPLNLNPFPGSRYRFGQTDLPLGGVVNMATGDGYAMIMETPEDAFLQMRTFGENFKVPVVGWMASMRTFRYSRKMFYHFISKGGYVSLAKRFRAYAKEQGLIVTLRDKVKQNPNLYRLFGAPDIWGNKTLEFAKTAKEAGVEKMLIHGSSSREEMAAINNLGYLTSDYDNYVDIRQVAEGKEIDSNHGQIPGDVVLKEDGSRMTAWLTVDKVQSMKRCPSRWLQAAQISIPKVLKEHPFLGRFIDVTTADGLYECFDTLHPLTREAELRCGLDLLGYVRSLGLVTGGEHGKWWAVPQLDYIEGMMSGDFYSWPSGYLIRPKSKDEQATLPNGRALTDWSQYERFGIGHQYRIPFWELVFHDCVVSTWYWGDSNDFLLTAAPEVTAKKDAFNILYGTIPMMWANQEGSWVRDREAFLNTYRNTCKLHEILALEEMLNHEFLTPDHSLQRTTFSGGTSVVVNFGISPQSVMVGSKQWVLPQNGFVVDGPSIKQSRAVINGKIVTSIQTSSFKYSETSEL